MSLNSIKILNVNITCDSRQKILEEMRKRLTKSCQTSAYSTEQQVKNLIIATPNPEQIVLSQKDFHFVQLLNEADVAIPDGIGVVWGVRFLNKLSAFKRIPGVEFMEDLMQLAAKEGFPTALIGGRSNLAVEAFECLQRKYPGLQGWAEDGPELEIKSNQLNQSTNPTRCAGASARRANTTKESKNLNKSQQERYLVIKQDGRIITDDYFVRLVRKIRETNIKIVFVGLGAPKQEYFIARLARSCQLSAVSCQLLFMSVGGSFDIIAGRVRRAPLVIRLIGFEWLWRLLQEPWRWRRQMVLLQFIWLVLKEKLSHL